MRILLTVWLAFFQITAFAFQITGDYRTDYLTSSLKDIGPIRVLATVGSPIDGLTEKELNNVAEFSLRTNGVPVSYTKSDVVLMILVGTIEHPDNVTYMARVQLWQAVSLAVNDNPTFATTWDDAIYGIASSEEVAMTLKRNTLELVNRFSLDYLSANPP